MDRITYLEKRVAELQKELAEAQSPRIFGKVLITLILVGFCYLVWKCRTFIKWGLLALIGWWIFGGTITNTFNSVSKWCSEVRADYRASSKVEDEHERHLERLKAETDAANSRVRTEAEAAATTTKATADADVARTTADANARTQVLQAEEAAKQADWERGQAERRNDAVNDAIRSGHWNASTPMTNPAVSAPESPEIVKPSTAPMPIAEPVAEAESKPNVTVNAPGRQPTVTRTQEGNTTRVVVRF
jgi:hypothetical protein